VRHAEVVEGRIEARYGAPSLRTMPRPPLPLAGASRSNFMAICSIAHGCYGFNWRSETGVSSQAGALSTDGGSCRLRTKRAVNLDPLVPDDVALPKMPSTALLGTIAARSLPVAVF